jgi:hypothetical protein
MQAREANYRPGLGGRGAAAAALWRAPAVGSVAVVGADDPGHQELPAAKHIVRLVLADVDRRRYLTSSAAGRA